jgi:(hydroxyamino)benzene mutase
MWLRKAGGISPIHFVRTYVAPAQSQPFRISRKRRTNKDGRAIMNSSNTRSRQGHRLIQIGVVLFLFTSFEGFAVPYFAAPNLGRSVHTLSAFSGVLLVALGLVWPRLTLGTAASRIAFWFLIFSDLSTIAAFLLAGIWGAGSSTIPIAAGGARGTDFQEAVIQAVIYPAAPTGIISFALILWGLRIATPQSRGRHSAAS